MEPISDNPFSLYQKGLESLRQAQEYQEKAYQSCKQGIAILKKYAEVEKDRDKSIIIQHNLHRWTKAAGLMEPLLPQNQSFTTINFPDHKQKDISPNENCDIMIETPKIRLEDIAGFQETKDLLHEAIIYPLQRPELFTGVPAFMRHVLVYGHSGFERVNLIKACAGETDATLLTLSVDDFIYKGENEKIVKTLFQTARTMKRAIILIEQIDYFCHTDETEAEGPRRAKTEFFIQLLGLEGNPANIQVVAVTSCPQKMDTSTRRKFRKAIYVPLPDYDARKALLRHKLSKISTSINEDDISCLAQKTDGFSCADLDTLIEDSSYELLKKSMSARKFKEVSKLTDGKPVYQDCNPSDSNGIAAEMLDILPDQIVLGQVQMTDIESALLRSKPVSQKELEEFAEFSRLFSE